METKEVVFTVKFKPKLGWADDIYLGNMLAEIVGTWARNTGAFDFSIEKQAGSKSG